MARLFEDIRDAVREERYVIGRHANERLRERGIPAWQIISGIEEGKLLLERPSDKLNPVVEVRQELADGTSVEVIWAWLRVAKVAKLVTVYFIDP